MKAGHDRGRAFDQTDPGIRKSCDVQVYMTCSDDYGSHLVSALSKRFVCASAAIVGMALNESGIRNAPL